MVVGRSESNNALIVSGQDVLANYFRWYNAAIKPNDKMSFVHQGIVNDLQTLLLGGKITQEDISNFFPSKQHYLFGLTEDDLDLITSRVETYQTLKASLVDETLDSPLVSRLRHEIMSGSYPTTEALEVEIERTNRVELLDSVQTDRILDIFLTHQAVVISDRINNGKITSDTISSDVEVLKLKGLRVAHVGEINPPFDVVDELIAETFSNSLICDIERQQVAQTMEIAGDLLFHAVDFNAKHKSQNEKIFPQVLSKLRAAYKKIRPNQSFKDWVGAYAQTINRKDAAKLVEDMFWDIFGFETTSDDLSVLTDFEPGDKVGEIKFKYCRGTVYAIHKKDGSFRLIAADNKSAQNVGYIEIRSSNSGSLQVKERGNRVLVTEELGTFTADTLLELAQTKYDGYNHPLRELINVEINGGGTFTNSVNETKNRSMGIFAKTKNPVTVHVPSKQIDVIRLDLKEPVISEGTKGDTIVEGHFGEVAIMLQQERNSESNFPFDKKKRVFRGNVSIKGANKVFFSRGSQNDYLPDIAGTVTGNIIVIGRRGKKDSSYFATDLYDSYIFKGPVDITNFSYVKTNNLYNFEGGLEIHNSDTIKGYYHSETPTRQFSEKTYHGSLSLPPKRIK